jgi:hypothetical protein
VRRIGYPLPSRLLRGSETRGEVIERCRQFAKFVAATQRHPRIEPPLLEPARRLDEALYGASEMRREQGCRERAEPDRREGDQRQVRLLIEQEGDAQRLVRILRRGDDQVADRSTVPHEGAAYRIDRRERDQESACDDAGQVVPVLVEQPESPIRQRYR